MASNYVIKEVDVDESEVFLRVATLSSGGSEYSGLSVSLDRRFTGKSEAPGVSAMNEVYLPLDTATIESIDGDNEKHEAFLRSHARLVEGNRANVCLVNYLLRAGEKPEAKNISYLNDLLLWSRNHVYVPPTLTFDRADKRPPVDRVEIYDEFVGKLLELKNKTVPGKLRSGVMIPRFYPRRSLDGLIGKFENESDEPAFYAIDFGNSKLGTSSIEQKVTAVHRHFLEEKDEKYFVYGMRVRPRQKGPPPGCAEDVTSLLSGLNAIGRPHRDTPMKAIFPPFTWDSLIGFHRSHYVYDCLMSNKTTRDSFVEYLGWQGVEAPNFSKPAKEDDKRFGGHLNNFSRRMVNVEGQELAKMVRSGDSKGIHKRLEGKEAAERARELHTAG